MKHTLLFAAWISICGLSPVYAQLGLSGQRSSAPLRFSSNAAAGGSLQLHLDDDEAAPGDDASGPQIDNPFDFLDGAPQTYTTTRGQEEAEDTGSQGSEAEQRDERGEQADANAFPSDSRRSVSPPPAAPLRESTPSILDSPPQPPQQAGQQSPRPSAPGIVDTLYGQSQLDAIPHAAYAPVYWPEDPCCRRQPIADYLMRQECIEGLWAGYAAQRARECQRMWWKLSGGHHACRSCGHTCSAAACDETVVNRYTQSPAGHAHPAAGCPHCGHSAERAGTSASPIRFRELPPPPSSSSDPSQAGGRPQSTSRERPNVANAFPPLPQRDILR